MAPTDLQAYLASKYMSGAKADAIMAREESKRKKGKKRKTDDGAPVTSGGLVVDDDAATGWNKVQEEDEQSMPAVEERNIEFKGKKKAAGGSWSVVRPAEKGEAEAPIPEDEQPQVVVEEASFTGGGLQSAASIKAQAEAQKRKREAAKRERELEKQREAAGEEPTEETIYRDASGRQIDTKAARAEEKRKRERELEAQMQKMEWGKGLAQREDVEAKKAELAKISNRPFARHVDDEEMNDEMKETQRWNDPAAAFLTTTTKKSKKPSRPKYQGPAPPPNRYGIPPGYRWDGVDRSNGFERQWSQKANERSRRTAEHHAWSVSDM